MMIKHITPEMLRSQPDQVCQVINKVIDKINQL